MLLKIDLTLPFEAPVLIFTLVLLIILIAPIVLNKFKIPGIVGMILAGVIIGPYGFGILERDASIELFGTVGLLYIMFLAGLEVDMIEFKKNKNKSLGFGALTFLIPITVGTAIFYYIFNYDLAPAILLSSMFSTHTLIAYPIASKLGISKNEAVTVTIGGTIITDTAVLLVLAVVAGSAEGDLDMAYWIRLSISLAIFTAIVTYIFPIIAKWFFKQLESEKGAHYIFVLTMVFAAAFLAELAGVEAIIGAFLAGLALNQLIPHTSPLMNRIEFVGNNLFIPFFLISVGMLVDVRVLLRGPEALIIAGTIVVVALTTKYLAAWATQKIYGYTSIQRNLIFGLSSAHAAATLAVILVGYNLGMINEEALNGTIVLILVTCLVSSFVTEKSGRALAIVESQKKPDLSQKPDRILVPIANPKNIESLVDLAIMMKNPDYNEPIYPLAVVIDDERAEEEIYKKNKMLQEAIKHASATDSDVQLVAKIDINIASGILRAIKELMITEVIIGWNAKITTSGRIFGTVLDNLLENTEQMILVCKIIKPINTTSRLVVVVPNNAELERGFLRWIRAIKILAQQLGARVVFRNHESTVETLKQAVQQTKPAIDAEYLPYKNFREFDGMHSELSPDDMVIVISARMETISYSSNMDNVPRILAKNYKDNSFIIIYPEQYPFVEENPVTGIPALYGSDREEGII
ncbi:transporter (CPA2 family) [Pontibacter mucosus]|uniref:Transporter (CPA2 family) n=1 Tax=Pontibacter mucosus TaxID=1649266 RepID=A0A2T5YSW6_9BACT|nr:cation:proton antiporter [Pontibacter mucosus]PTX22417.1 transporter (CPA2 family) [Pontibacter mucosus]